MITQYGLMNLFPVTKISSEDDSMLVGKKCVEKKGEACFQTATSLSVANYL